MNINKSFILLNISLLISWQAVDGAPFVYVANGASSSFSVIDEVTGAPIAGSPFAVPNSANLVGVAISSDNQTAYMIDQANSALIAINTATNTILSTTVIPITINQVLGGAIAINGSTAYIGISNQGGSPTDLLLVKITNPSAPILGAAIQIVASNVNQVSIEDIVISNNTAYATVVGSTFASIVSVDLSSLVVTGVAVIPDHVFPYGIAIDTNVNIAYVANVGTNPNSVQGFQLPNITLSGSSIAVGSNPVGIVISIDNHYAYVTNQNDGTVSVIDLTVSPPSVVATISGAGNQPNNAGNIAISADNKTVYVATGASGNNTVTPITVLTRTAGTPIPVGGSANALAITGTLAPTNVVGVRKNNVFLLQTARYVTITWSASVTPGVTSYNIYNGTTLIGSVPATSPLTFNAFIPAGDNGNNLFVTAVSPLGGESISVPVAVA